VLRDRVSDYTDELEERLRQHWPRKGRTEVDQKQPRVTELNAHKEQLMRHVRAIARRDEGHTEQHSKLLVEAKQHIDTFSAAMQVREGRVGRERGREEGRE
jgi:hypothetical protein